MRHFKRPKLQYKKMPEEKAKSISKGNDIVSNRLNPEQREILEKAKVILCCDRDSTVMTELMLLGYYNVLHDTYFATLVPKIVDRIKRGLYENVLLNQEKSNFCNTKED
jgi:hypothetical protein